MNRMVIQLRQDQQVKLRALAKKEKVSISELVRQGVDKVLSTSTTDEDMRRKAINAVGFICDESDTSINHDKYLTEAYIK